MLKKLLALSMMVVCILCLSSTTVFATSISQNGLEVRLTTDKQNYSKDETLTVTLSVKNTKTTDIRNVIMENAISNDYKLDGNSTNVKSLDILTPNQTAEMKIVYVPKLGSSQISTGNNSDSQIATGDQSAVFVTIIVLILALILIICLVAKNKKSKQLLGITLALSLSGYLALTYQMKVTAVEQMTINISENIKIGGENITLYSSIKYSGENITSVSEEEQVTVSLKNTLNCMINTNFTEDFKYLNMYGNVKSELGKNDIPCAVAKNISYNIKEIKIDTDDKGNSFAIIDTEFKTVDMVDLISALEEDVSDYRKVVVNQLNNKDYKEKNVNTQLAMMKIDDVWYLYETVELDDIFTGGLYSLEMDIKQKFFDALRKESE